jgi:hypothetical protein
MPLFTHTLSLKENLPPSGPFVVTDCTGLEPDRWIEQGLTDTPWSILHIAGMTSLEAPAGGTCDAMKGSAFEVGGADAPPAHPASIPATARAAKDRSDNLAEFILLLT